MKIKDAKSYVNKNSWVWLAPEYFSRWRIFPRGFILVYFWLIIQTAMWFMTLAEPTPAQAAFASAIITAGAAWFGLYVNSGNNNNRFPSHRNNHDMNLDHDVSNVTVESEVSVTKEYKPRVIANTKNKTNQGIDDYETYD